jgi:hypothetical protein
MFVTVLGVAGGGDSSPQLPTSPAPIQILAQLDDKGNLTLVIPYTVFVKEDAPKGSGAEYEIVPETREETRTVPLKEVKVYETDGKEADLRRLPGVLRKPTPALLAADGKLDPVRLRLVKDGTLIFVGPTSKGGTFKFEPK